jgi:hypothetical protein
MGAAELSSYGLRRCRGCGQAKFLASGVNPGRCLACERPIVLRRSALQMASEVGFRVSFIRPSRLPPLSCALTTAGKKPNKLSIHAD